MKEEVFTREEAFKNFCDEFLVMLKKYTGHFPLIMAYLSAISNLYLEFNRRFKEKKKDV